MTRPARTTEPWQLAIEYEAHGIRVNASAPGGSRPASTTQFLGHLDEIEPGRLVAQQVPLGRQGTADDIAPSLTFLASDWARYITGRSLRSTAV